MRDLIKIFAAGTILTAYALVVPGLAESGLGAGKPQVMAQVRLARAF